MPKMHFMEEKNNRYTYINQVLQNSIFHLYLQNKIKYFLLKQTKGHPLLSSTLYKLFYKHFQELGCIKHINLRNRNSWAMVLSHGESLKKSSLLSTLRPIILLQNTRVYISMIYFSKNNIPTKTEISYWAIQSSLIFLHLPSNWNYIKKAIHQPVADP